MKHYNLFCSPTAPLPSRLQSTAAGRAATVRERWRDVDHRGTFPQPNDPGPIVSAQPSGGSAISESGERMSVLEWAWRRRHVRLAAGTLQELPLDSRRLP